MKKTIEQSVKSIRQPVDLQKAFRFEMESRVGFNNGILSGFIHSCAEAAEHVFYKYCKSDNIRRRTIRIKKTKVYSYALKVMKLKTNSYQCACGYKYLSVDYQFCPKCGTALMWHDAEVWDGSIVVAEALESNVNSD